MKKLLMITEQIKEILLIKQWHLSVAESLTGGLCQSTLVECPGISQVFSGGVVSYTDDIKQHILNVDKDVLLSQTAVSQAVSEQMVQGVKKLFKANVALSFTGEAGPFAQVGELGQVFISVMIENDIYTQTLHLNGSRNDIRQQAVYEGLLFLLHHLQKMN